MSRRHWSYIICHCCSGQTAAAAAAAGRLAAAAINQLADQDAWCLPVLGVRGWHHGRCHCNVMVPLINTLLLTVTPLNDAHAASTLPFQERMSWRYR